MFEIDFNFPLNLAKLGQKTCKSASGIYFNPAPQNIGIWLTVDLRMHAFVRVVMCKYDNGLQLVTSTTFIVLLFRV